MRRCYDCGNYDRLQEKCAVNAAQVYVAEAETPKEYSKSDKCPDDKPKYEDWAVFFLSLMVEAALWGSVSMLGRGREENNSGRVSPKPTLGKMWLSDNCITAQLKSDN